MRNLESESVTMECTRKKQPLSDLNEFFTCKLCSGYLVDATTLVECLHTFCRSCLLRHFEGNKTQVQCPVCPVLYKKKSQCFRPDLQLQSLIYKTVPSLYSREMQRQDEFLRSSSEDSIVEEEEKVESDIAWMKTLFTSRVQLQKSLTQDRPSFFNQDDLISLSLEYYQPHLDTTDVAKKDTGASETCLNSDSAPPKNNGQTISDSDNFSDNTGCDKRFLQCPAGVNMKHLQKFVRMKYGLTADHRVDIIYKGEVLPNDFSLMDVAYSFCWQKIKPMRFFYRIFTPMKIRPIKIINTPTPTGGKQLQIVPVTVSSTPTTPKSPRVEPVLCPHEETESEQQDKERLLANLQLQSKSKALQIAEAKKAQTEKLIKDCVFDYEEPDQEEIKRFAEKRDREWALQKKLEEETSADRDDFFLTYPSKKRKKSKHSKNDSNGHKEKKRKIHGDKIHAEITNNDKSDLKLKVKITTNGHKHKHHKIENNSELSNKEKLLQMRQVRHKPTSGSDEPIPTIKFPKSYLAEPSESKKKKTTELPAKTFNPTENNNKPVKSREVAKCPTGSAVKRPAEYALNHQSKVAKKEATLKASEQKTFLKSAATNTDKFTPKEQKVSQNKAPTPVNNKVLPIGSITTNNKSLDRKIASLQQRCTIEPKHPSNSVRLEGKTTDKGKAPQYPPGFTVSKIDSGVKRKDDSTDQDQRPSLEITLIPPVSKPEPKLVPVKRPPPGTIPLERIKNLKPGISIIPKIPDNNGVLDLSKASKSPEVSPRASPKTEPINGLNSMVNRQLTPRPLNSPGRATPENKIMQLSNLQMLSKVATEHPILNKLAANNINKTRPQIPSLHSITKFVPTAIRSGLPPRMPPKLNDIQKFRPASPQIRSLRPNSQNQNIRNIPNPSLILNRHQNLSQNKPSPVHQADSVTEKKVASPKPSPVAVTSTSSTPVVEQKVSEVK